MKDIGKFTLIIIAFMFFSLNNVLKYTGSMTKQLIFYGLGFVLFFGVSKMDKKQIYKYVFPVYIILNVLLLYLLLFGSSINGSKAWIDLGFFSFQPSELMKITLIILLSIVVNTKEKYVLFSFIITLIPSVLTFLEPDTGNVIFYFVILFSILLLKIKNIRKFIPYILCLVCGTFLFMYLYFYNKSLFVRLFGSSFFYRMDRIVNLFSSSYQLDMALMNMGVSGLLGSSSVVGIPEATTDFAFSLLVSLNGFIGTVIFLAINFCFDFLIIKKLDSSDVIMQYVIFSFLFMKIFQSSIHILMNIGLLPITGITLPFISSGGTSLLTYFFAIGLINNCYNNMGDNTDMV
ncbi:MAG: FtsW/RodA/SpoVE family cell cycle protein [Bacilli bacterium]|nr:FtsW/RodA/SpoVE family cell cycle protein [Bacilli bacterium]